jgi:hypothetical protein
VLMRCIFMYEYESMHVCVREGFCVFLVLKSSIDVFNKV